MLKENNGELRFYFGSQSRPHHTREWDLLLRSVGELTLLAWFAKKASDERNGDRRDICGMASMPARALLSARR